LDINKSEIICFFILYSFFFRETYGQGVLQNNEDMLRYFV